MLDAVSIFSSSVLCGAAPPRCWSDFLIIYIFISTYCSEEWQTVPCWADYRQIFIDKTNFLRKKTTFMVLAAITVERNSSSSEPLDCKKYQMEGPHYSSTFALSPPALVHSQSRRPLQGTVGTLKVNNRWPVDRFTKTFFWNFQKSRAVLFYMLIDKQMLH